MPKTKIPSPARSQGATTPKRNKKLRGSRSLCSPALSTASGRLTSLIDQFKDKNMESFALSPLNRRSILNDDTAIEEPRRKSWWKNLKEDSHEIMEVLEDNKVVDGGNNAIEELIDIEVLSQEKKEYTLDLPESSDNESINSIVLPQRKLFTQKENKPQKKFGQFNDNRETLAKLHKTNTQSDKTVNVGTRELFQNAKRSKPIFPAALLNISPNKTAADKTKENILPEPKVRNIFGNRPANKRKNMFADFVVSESEDEIPEIQPRVFGFQKKLEQRRISSISKGREGSPASSITTDMEMDDWKLLPSSTMVENQLEDIVAGRTPKRARLSKLSEAKESEAGTNTLRTNSTGDKTKLSNKSVTSKNKSPDIKDKSLNSSRTTRSMLKNASVLEEKAKPSKQDTKANKTHSKISSKDDELDVSSSKATNKQNTSLNKSQRLNKSRTRNSSKLIEEEIESDENVVKHAINDATRVISKNASNATGASKSINDKERTITLKVHDKASETGSNKEEEENNFILQYEDEIVEEGVDHNEINENKTSKIKTRNTIVIEKDNQESEVDKLKSNKSMQKEPKPVKTVEESVESGNEQSGNDNIDGNEAEVEQNHDSHDAEKASQELNEKSNNSEQNDERNVSEDNEDQENDEEEMDVSQENDEGNESDNTPEAILSRVDEENESEVNEESEGEDVNESNENEEQNESQEVEAEVDESQEIEEQNESEQIENEADESQEVNEEADDSKVEENDSEVEEENQEVENDEEEENVEKSQEVDNEEENEESQEIENHDVSQESEHEVSQEVGHKVSQEVENDEESQQIEEEVENQDEDDDEDQEAENDNEHDEEENEESQEIENDEENQAESEAEVNESQVESEAEVNESQEIEDDQEMDDSDEADRAIASDPEISDQDDNDADEIEVDEDDDNNEQESENEETEENQEETHEDQQEPSAEEIEESPNVTHDTTGRHRQKVLKSPEAILHDKTNQMDSFTAKGRNTSIRKTKSMIKNLNIRPSLAPQRDSLAFSDGTRDSSAEGSGWDSHRTTRKTLRQTFGKDFTPRKSLRALVMEKSAKRQTEHMDLHSETSKYPQANSTELPEDSNGHVEDFVVESDHEVSRRTRQTTLEMYLQKIKQQNIENKVRMEELVRNSLKAPARDTLSLFKVPSKPAPRRLKSTQNKPRAQVKSITAFGELPTEVIEDMKYKPPKRFQPTNASWITKRLYKFLETKLEPKYDYKARVRAEKLVETIYHFAKDLRRHDVAPTDAVDVLKHELARLEVVQTHFEFYEFFHEFMPREVRVKVVPDIVNKIALPRHGVFSDILRGNNVQG
ncbi:unnamed protein product [Spodoptera littoralis]|uniref:Uncharacterized protein n=1 Tax=Spodoptera littoralis TaxID=7109 RepID=A0A9P0I314_SPOLI|nr:unnamed protein product [Spodoptera littoralis]CAH1638866.1 unnamed protein product [Spodoptera littoralis]